MSGGSAGVRVIIIRHGKAHRDSATGRDDDRQLRPRGERQAQWMGQALARHAPPVRVVHCSPILRARHTARIIADVLACELNVRDELSTHRGAADAMLLIEELAGALLRGGVVCVVGHNPTLEIITARLIGAHDSAVTMRTGEGAVIDFPDGYAPGLGNLVEKLRMDDEGD